MRARSAGQAARQPAERSGPPRRGVRGPGGPLEGLGEPSNSPRGWPHCSVPVSVRSSRVAEPNSQGAGRHCASGAHCGAAATRQRGLGWSSVDYTVWACLNVLQLTLRRPTGLARRFVLALRQVKHRARRRSLVAHRHRCGTPRSKTAPPLSLGMEGY